MAIPEPAKISLKQTFIVSLQSEISELTAKLEAKNKELSDFQAVSDEAFDRIYRAGVADKAVMTGSGKTSKQPVKKAPKGKGSGTGTTHISDDQKAALETGFLAILDEGGGEMFSKHLKPKFLKLDAATDSRFGTVKKDLVTAGKITQEGNKAGAKYKKV